MIQAVVVGEIPFDGGGVLPAVVEVAGYTHSVATRTFEVGKELTVVFLIGGTDTLTSPRIGLVLDDTLIEGVANHTKSGELPFSFGRETVVGQENTIGTTDVTILTTAGGIKVRHTFTFTLVKTGQIDIGLEGFGTGELRLCKVDDAGINKDFLVDTVGTPFAELRGLLPSHTDNRIVVEHSALEIVLDEVLDPGEALTPHVGVGINLLDQFGILLAIGTVHPIYKLAVGEIGHLGLVDVERRDGDGVDEIVP